MKSSVKIVNGKLGFILKVNGLYINLSTDGQIKAIENNLGIPYGATEFCSIQAIRDFWNTKMIFILASLKTPFKSVWGQLIMI
jgi:hypothetical protein